MRTGILTLALLLLPTPAWAQSAREHVVASLTLVRAAAQAAPDVREGRMGAALEQLFDFSALTRALLGELWAPLDRAQRDRLVALVHDVVVAAALGGQGLADLEVDRGEASHVDATRGESVLRLRPRDGRGAWTGDVRVHLARTDLGWRILDFEAGGVSYMRSEGRRLVRRIRAHGLRTVEAELEARARMLRARARADH